MTRCPPSCVQSFDVPPFKVHVALFETFPQFHECCPEGPDPDEVGLANAAALRWQGDGVTWFAMVIPNGLEVPTVAHECSHLVDFILDHCGVPMGVENSELRGFLLEFVLSETLDLLDQRDPHR
ncbi:hypothetical protein [Limimaricola cinnabarinus]|uniref:hypothetical protein n=1 Tax=Limimaricola cinnabarinus TaxID=1125964 RepID=UPI002492A6E1|nr:hypothetical protein [Limimaricola cinnabarinus]